MGASLLAKASAQPTSMLNVPTFSRAGSLPQGSLCCRDGRPFLQTHNNHKNPRYSLWPLISKIAALRALPCAVQALPNAGSPTPGYSPHWR
ncbi:hypothetical protein FE275_07905 [Pseudomonas koreensis]|nr:hypothetical protein FE275_07905 [Pseudomonas koreensis]